MKKKIIVAPSILSADFANLERDINTVSKAGAEWLHIDVMDGHFVPNITIGPAVVRSVRKITQLTLDVHLMITEPEKFIEPFVKAGSDIITFHVEASPDPAKVIKLIKGFGVKAGISIKPKTPLATIAPYVPGVDMVLVMSVEPGFGGQEFMETALPKIEELRGLFAGLISVDGGINGANAGRVTKAGADILVAGNYLFSAADMRAAVDRLRT
ncbi:MAG: ribulose-phosphate 3-epimerase [Candidatus Omnitrophota bacterium]